MHVRMNSSGDDDCYLLPKMMKLLFSVIPTSHAKTGSSKMHTYNISLHSCVFLPLLLLLVIGKIFLHSFKCLTATIIWMRYAITIPNQVRYVDFFAYLSLRWQFFRVWKTNCSNLYLSLMIISPLFAHEKSSISKKSITSLLTVFKMNQEDMLNDFIKSFLRSIRFNPIAKGPCYII